jgi:hypothetical protein
MNDILKNQNSEYSIGKLSAQRYLYSRAKYIFISRLALSVVFAIVGPILIFNFESIKIYVAVFAIFYTVIDFFFLRKVENDYRKQGAIIQELFDTELFMLPWNGIVVGDKPDEENVYAYSQKYKSKNKNLDNLNNWYSNEVSNLNISQACAVCQRTNVWWDVSLRTRLLISLISFIFLLTFLIFIFLCKNSENLFLFIASLLPFYETLLDYAKSQFSSIDKIKKLKTHIEKVLDKIIARSIDDVSLKTDLRIIQDEIFRHRATCLFVPDFFYKFFRNKQEEQMNVGAKHYVDIILDT